MASRSSSRLASAPRSRSPLCGVCAGPGRLLIISRRIALPRLPSRHIGRRVPFYPARPAKVLWMPPPLVLPSSTFVENAPRRRRTFREDSAPVTTPAVGVDPEGASSSRGRRKATVSAPPANRAWRSDPRRQLYSHVSSRPRRRYGRSRPGRHHELSARTRGAVQDRDYRGVTSSSRSSTGTRGAIRLPEACSSHSRASSPLHGARRKESPAPPSDPLPFGGVILVAPLERGPARRLREVAYAPASITLRAPVPR